MRQVGRLGVFALAALFAFGGCDGSGGAPPVSSSTEQAKVKGKVTLKGKPLASVEVRFNPANVKRKTAPSVSATAGDDGSYAISTLVGENTVSLVGPVATRNPAVNYFSMAVDVKAGDNTVNVNVP